MHRNVHDAERGAHAFDLLDVVGDAAGDLHAAGRNAGYDEVLEIRISLNNFVSDPPDRLADRVRIHRKLRCFACRFSGM